MSFKYDDANNIMEHILNPDGSIDYKNIDGSIIKGTSKDSIIYTYKKTNGIFNSKRYIETAMDDPTTKKERRECKKCKKIVKVAKIRVHDNTLFICNNKHITMI